MNAAPFRASQPKDMQHALQRLVYRSFAAHGVSRSVA